MTATYLYRVLLSRVRRSGPAADRQRRARRAPRRRRRDRRSSARAPGFADWRERAAELHDELARLDWLMEPDPVAAGFIRRGPTCGRPCCRCSTSRRRSGWRSTSDATLVRRAHGALGRRRGGTSPPTPAPSARAALRSPGDAGFQIDEGDLRARRGAGSRAAESPRSDSCPPDDAAAPAAPRATPRRRASAPDAAAVPRTALGERRSDWQERATTSSIARSRARLSTRTRTADTALTFLSGPAAGPRRASSSISGADSARPSADQRATRAVTRRDCRPEMGAETAFDAFVEALRHDEASDEHGLHRVQDHALKPGRRGSAIRAPPRRRRHRTLADGRGSRGRRPSWAPAERSRPIRDREQPDPPASVVAAGWDCIVARAGSVDPATMDPAAALARSAAVLTRSPISWTP